MKNMDNLYKIIGNVKEESLEAVMKRAKETEEDIEGFKFINEMFLELDEENLEFKKCIFHNCKVQGKFEKTYFTYVIFENCDFSNCSFYESNFNNVYFKNCKFVGSNFIENRLNQINIDNCNFNYSNFNISTLRDCEIKESDFNNSEFEDVTFNKLIIKEDYFIGTRFFKTKLEGIDFTDCEIEGISAEINDVKGMIVNHIQAVEVSKLLGIVVK